MGCRVGPGTGNEVGIGEGCNVDGQFDGPGVGIVVGEMVGTGSGFSVGFRVGDADAWAVGGTVVISVVGFTLGTLVSSAEPSLT